ncbi:DUF4160 domain-containing protein [Fibrella forsythiae]|uniref:DUF4160 domain-containing protein n=1 Tax=Fibrella forsythiae TaxID=2817061 RepID=A0ABS3JFW1_9BACT|nr:DUF4160 domain-containing protein [Fibrella forsythiae]MBO0948889.1 DUF4160 domain-containing protein [Fibrella forsythiae]
MPTVLLIDGYRFFFYMNDHEPIHVHVSKAGKEARFDLVPEIDLTYCHGFKKNELREIVTLLVNHYDTFISAWRQTFGE